MHLDMVWNLFQPQNTYLNVSINENGMYGSMKQLWRPNKTKTQMLQPSLWMMMVQLQTKTKRKWHGLRLVFSLDGDKFAITNANETKMAWFEISLLIGW